MAPTTPGLLLRDADLVLGIEPDYAALDGLELGVIGPYTASSVAQGVWQPQATLLPRISGTREELRPLDYSDQTRSEERFGAVVFNHLQTLRCVLLSLVRPSRRILQRVHSTPALACG